MTTDLSSPSNGGSKANMVISVLLMLVIIAMAVVIFSGVAEKTPPGGEIPAEVGLEEALEDALEETLDVFEPPLDSAPQTGGNAGELPKDF